LELETFYDQRRMTFSKKLTPFVAASFIHLTLIILGEAQLVQITKPFLMPLLIFYFWSTTPKTPLSRFIIIALACSFIGDTLLIFSSSQELFFMTGLVAFLLAHIVFILINLSAVNEQAKRLKLQWQDIIFVGLGLFFFSFIKDDLGELYFPVVMYTVIICLMALTARKRWNKVCRESFWLVMSGAIIFMLSDFLLAVDKFNGDFEYAQFSIMFTYLMAQFLLIQGYKVFVQNLLKES